MTRHSPILGSLDRDRERITKFPINKNALELEAIVEIDAPKIASQLDPSSSAKKGVKNLERRKRKRKIIRKHTSNRVKKRIEAALR